MQRLGISLLLILSFVSVLISGNGGSGYSRYGLGDLKYFYSDRASGMGNTGIAAFSSGSIERLNPASWSTINRTRFSIGAMYEGYNTTDGTSSAFLSGTSFGGFMVAFPVYTPSGIVFGAGITPFSTINYNISSNSSFGSLLYNINYKGEGGVSEGHLGFSFNAHPDLSVGAKYTYYFGTMRHIVSQQFSSSDYSNAEEIRSMQVHGIGASLGLIYSGLNNILHLDTSRSLTLGLVAATGSTISGTEEHFLKYDATNQNITTRDTISLPESQLNIPVRLGIGVAFRTPEFLVASDLHYQQWSNFSGNGVITGSFRDSYRFSVGGELFPRREGTATFFQRIAYRLGFFADASYLQINNEPINETVFTGGFGVPIFGDTRLNIAAEYSFRGTTVNGLQKDKIIRLSFMLSGSERWFVPSEEE
ncbi:MAG: hypothetical protein HYZ33_03100 [Ignavibacteriales bacterium]|nr:hypothetical protein [Ignavibacteriales bacterium]